MNLTTEELIRYSRHVSLPYFGLEAQQKLKDASVLVVGAGGLGCPTLIYLAAVGVGKIGIVDFDTVSVSNLQRQILYSTEDVGQPKARTAQKKLSALNDSIYVSAITSNITSQNALAIAEKYDLIVDASDNFQTRYLLCDVGVLLNKPVIYGAVFRYEGQVSVFNLHGGPIYRDLHPTPPQPDAVANCEQTGVLGVLTGFIGTLQAGEVIKIITNIGSPLAGELFLFDSLTLESSKVKIKDRGQRSKVTHLIDYDYFCGDNKSKTQSTMKEVTVQELKAMKDSQADFQLIDVREPHEYEICEIGGELIPMAEVPFHLDKISRSKQVVVHCRSGKRSGDIIQWLEKNQSYANLYNLKGGILAWGKEIDPSIASY